MSWNLSANGHCYTEEEEQEVVAQLKAAFADVSSCSYVSMMTAHQGTVVLKDVAPVPEQKKAEVKTLDELVRGKQADKTTSKPASKRS